MIKDILLKTAKTLATNKDVHRILKYLATSTLMYAGQKLFVNPCKSDINDMRNMVYRNNMNNNEKINPQVAEDCYSIKKIDDFIKEFCKKYKIDPTNIMIMLLHNIGNMTDKKEMDKIIDQYKNNNIMDKFNMDTLKTSSIVTNQEIETGGIYVPNKDIILNTDEGKIIANNKNDYLENRINLGENAFDEEVRKLIKEYHKINKTKEAIEYFDENINK